MNQTQIVNTLSDLKHRLFPRPFERLAVSGTNLIGVEIGVYKGEHAKSLLTYLDIQRLYLIDPYTLYDEYTEGKQHYGVDQDSLQCAREMAESRLARYSDQVTWLFCKSSEAIDRLPNCLDFCYIDGNHADLFVRADILAFYPKVRVGGVLGGHDFYNGFCREHDGVIRAVTQFAVLNSLPLQVELPDWWIKKQ